MSCVDPALMGSGRALRRRLLSAGFHVKLVDAVAYWRALHRRGLPPSRADIDPAQVRALLPSLALLDAQTADGGPRYRLAGTGVVELMGCEPTGQAVRQVASPLRGFLLEAWAGMIAQETAGGGVARGRLARYRDDGDGLGGLYQYECAFLPLTATGRDAASARVLLCLLRRFISDAMTTPGDATGDLLVRAE